MLFKLFKKTTIQKGDRDQQKKKKQFKQWQREIKKNSWDYILQKQNRKKGNMSNMMLHKCGDVWGGRISTSVGPRRQPRARGRRTGSGSATPADGTFSVISGGER